MGSQAANANAHYVEELMQLKSYYQDSQLSDVVFVFPDSPITIPAHRLILSLRSHAFKEAFLNSHTSKPSKQLRLPIKIVVKDVRLDIFSCVLRFIYENTLEARKDNPIDFLLDILRAAVLYQVKTLLSFCIDTLQQYITSTSALKILIALDQLKNQDIVTELQQECEKVIENLGEKQFVDILHDSINLQHCTTARLTSLFRVRSRTPLLLAVQTQLLRVVDALIVAGEPIDDIDFYGANDTLPLVQALKLGASKCIIERILLGHKNQTTNGTYLHLAAASGSLVHCTLLLDKEYDINAMNSNGKTPLHIAAEFKNANIVNLLLQQETIVPNLQDEEGNTALHVAQDEVTIQALLSAKANLNIPNLRGRVPLHSAAASGNVGVANLLLENGADQSLMDDQGQTPLHVASASGNVAIVLILLKSAEDQLITTNDEEDKQVETSSFDINVLDAKGNSALHLAAMSNPSNCDKVIRVLLENGSDSNIGNWIGHTPLHLFCAHQDGPGSTIEAFIENGAKIDIQGADGSTPLHLAIGRPSEANAIALVRGGAQLHYRDMANRTVVDLAESTSQGNLVVPLLRNVSKPPEWLADDSVSECSICSMNFSVATRKHHCRHCGLIVCYNCSTQSIALPKFEMHKPVRVCQLCFDVLSFRRLL